MDESVFLEIVCIMIKKKIQNDYHTHANRNEFNEATARLHREIILNKSRITKEGRRKKMPSVQHFVINKRKTKEAANSCILACGFAISSLSAAR